MLSKQRQMRMFLSDSKGVRGSMVCAGKVPLEGTCRLCKTCAAVNFVLPVANQ